MMQVRCHKCGWNYTLSRATIADIMDEVKESRATHYTIDCPKCRQGIKVQVKQLKRFYHPQAAPKPEDEG